LLNKLAFTGIKSRLKDYVVLFFGLVISSAIFYMFEALATNQSFLKANAQVTGAQFIFQFGAVLLTIITLVYIFYANSFLMSMRRHDYGLFMMLGAKQSKIGQLILVETMVIGTIASVIGAIVGCALTGVLGPFLMTKLLQTQLQHFAAFYMPAFVTTIVLYVVLFFIAGIINRISLTKTPVLSLLHGDSQPNRPTLKPVSQLIQVIVGLGLLAVGYYAMSHLKTLQLMAIPLALVTIVLGTYFLFNAIFVWLVVLLKRTSWATKGLGNFTLAQLSFRIRNYTKILSIVSILFALALGAITVGIGMNRQVYMMANANSAYTAAFVDPSAKTQQSIDQLSLKTKAKYDQKETKTTVYYNAEQLKQTPLQTNKGLNDIGGASDNRQALKTPKFSGIAVTDLQRDSSPLNMLQSGTQRQKIAKVVSAAKFKQIAGVNHQLTVFRVKDLKTSQPALKKLVANAGIKSVMDLPGSYSTLVMGITFFGGFEFMGFFLGIAFLAMLASCLMFKILSGAASDQIRYQMLNKIGTRQSVLRRSIVKEIFVLFILPAIVGVVHVLFGLQMFKLLMVDPYDQLWLPFTIFGLLYMIYYVITVLLYEHIVLPKVKIDR
jgi:putative ABC transport system permease protein